MPQEPEPEGTPADKLPERILASLPGLTRFVRHRMGPELRARESASDIVQSTIRSILQAETPFEDRGEASFQAWLRTAARNKILTRARHWSAERRKSATQSSDGDAPDAAEPETPESADPGQEAQLREEVDRLRRAFAALPQDQRDLLVRSQVQGASHAEIAREMGRTPDSVRKAVARALAQLAASLEP
ncbi:MAG: RNA polymerase sigma factor [Planctomycetota bacterium]|nr:RNA polymerase sigma factor [Planctomycetota bacterium]